MALSFLGLAISILQLGVFLVLSIEKQQQQNAGNTGRRLTIGEHAPAAGGPNQNAPVILLGLPRSGSLAIHEYLECQGWTSAHYCCGKQHATSKSTKFPCLDGAGPTCGDCVLKNLKGHRPAFSDCGSSTTTTVIWSQYDVETADAWFLPQHFALGLLHQAYPNATWILNTRGSAREWAESMFHWHGMTRRFLTTFGGLPMVEQPLHAMTIPPPAATDKVTPEELEVDMQLQLDARVYNQTEHLRKLVLLQRIYENHTATVYRWARHFPSHPFVHINVDGDATNEKSILSTLDRIMVVGSRSRKGKSGCQWNFQSPTQDWKDFSFPFET